MYKYIDQQALADAEVNITWKDHLKLNTDCVNYLEIVSLYGGSLLMLGLVYIVLLSILFQIVTIIQNIMLNMKEILK